MGHRNHKDKSAKEQKTLKEISLDYEIDEQLFGATALSWSEQINNESSKTVNKINQIRGFYEKVIELNDNAENMSDEQYIKGVYPFVVMLNSKAAYAKSRGLVSDTFVRMIEECVKKAKTVKKMKNFKLFFEAVIGFYPKQ